MVKTSKVPKDWIGCPSKGDSLVESKFVVFKTPLSERYDNKLPITDRFYPEDVFYNENEKPGLWIDLTNTDRYYPKRDIEEQGCIYEKIECDGHGSVPRPKQVDKFISIVQEFLRETPDGRIGVHCTHGFNRTGYMVVSFLVMKLKQDVAYAVESFARARPPGIYRQRYIVELFRNHGALTSAPPAPKVPSWIANPLTSNLPKRSRKSKPDPKPSDILGWRRPENGQRDDYSTRTRQRYDPFDSPWRRVGHDAGTEETGSSRDRYTREYDWSQSSRSRVDRDERGSGPICASWRNVDSNPSREPDLMKDKPRSRESDVPRLSIDHSKGNLTDWPVLPRTILPGFLQQDSNAGKSDLCPNARSSDQLPNGLNSKGPGPLRSPQNRLDSNPYQKGAGLYRLRPELPNSSQERPFGSDTRPSGTCRNEQKGS